MHIQFGCQLGRFLLVAVLGLFVYAGAVYADDIGEKLEEAKARHVKAVGAAKKDLAKGIEQAIKESAAKGSLEEVRALLAAKDAFEADGSIPTIPAIKESCDEYVRVRKASASSLHSDYQTAIKAYLAKLLVTQATAMEDELNKFVAAEKLALSATAKKTAPAEKPKVKTTQENFDAFYTRYTEGMERVREAETSARKNDVYRDLVKKLDESIKSQTWTFHCVITDVKTVRNNGKDESFLLHIERPKEAPEFRERWYYRQSISNIRLSRQQALDLKPGDILVITGTPRFSARDDDDDQAFFSHSQSTQHILLTHFKAKIQKAGTPDPDGTATTSPEPSTESEPEKGSIKTIE